ncbi:hypothetical protein [Caproicibacterium sp. XB2]|uniref:hypothetical protein n=1 Tax=Caproicibacterium sp. XB2 TaxID=3388458 RepID=UPI003850D390
MYTITFEIGSVAPYTGAWIEITSRKKILHTSTSLPTRERGLKSAVIFSCSNLAPVAPYTGAWIEIDS